MTTKTTKIAKNPNWSSLDLANARVKNIVSIFRKKADAIRKDTRLSAQAKEEDLAKLRTDLLAPVLKESKEDAAKLLTAMRESVKAEAERKPETDVMEDIRNELQRQRVWNNLRPGFESAFSGSGPDLLVLVQTLAKQANDKQDHTLLTVLQDDLPYLFRTSSLAVNTDGTDKLEAQLRTIIDEATPDMMPEWVKQSQEDLKTLEQAESLFNLNVHEVTKSLDESDLTGDIVFSELTGETTTLTGEKGTMTTDKFSTQRSGKVVSNSWQPGYGEQGTQVTVSDAPPE